jgi:HlyD family secretion protein
VQLAKMQESLNNMQENLTLVRSRADNLKVKATYDGQLGSFSAELGQNIGAGMLIGQINVLGEYKITVNIDERYIDRIVAGLQGTFERQNVKYGVQVSTVYPEVRNGQFRADLTFTDETPENIRVGQTYYINLELGEPSQALLVPRGGFYTSTGGKWIFVLSPDGSEAVRRNIKIARQNPQYYEVVEGLSAGESVIVSGYDSFGDAEKLILK